MLGAGQWPGIVSNEIGFAAWPRVVQGFDRFALEVLYPAKPDIQSAILEYVKPANQKFVQRLYSLCNGIRSENFSVYGLPTKIQSHTDVGMGALPLDLNIPNSYGEQHQSFPSSFFAAVSSVRGTDKELHHIIDADPRIMVIEERGGEIRREYSTVDDWLRMEIAIATKQWQV